MNNVFGLDIGTRNVVGTVGYQTDEDVYKRQVLIMRGTGI